MKLIVAGLLALGVSSALSAEIYSGEPLGEALHDLSGSGVMIAHVMTTASPLKRTDVFRLRDGRLVAITSEAKKIGEPYSIAIIQPTQDSKSQLTNKTKTVNQFKLNQNK